MVYSIVLNELYYFIGFMELVENWRSQRADMACSSYISLSAQVHKDNWKNIDRLTNVTIENELQIRETELLSQRKANGYISA